MAKVSPLINNFTSGEFGPLASARVDLDRYPSSMDLCQDYIPAIQGGLMRRVGSHYVSEAKSSAKKTRLEKFSLSDEQSYVLEIGDLYFRFYKNGAQILNAGTPVEIVTPYTEAQIFDVTVTAVNDALYVFHPSHAPRKLLRFSDTNWSLSTWITHYTPFIKYPYLNQPALVKAEHAVNTSGVTGSITVSITAGQGITNAVAHTTGEILITVTTGTASRYLTGDRIVVSGVSGTVEANGVWGAEVINASQIVLKGSTFVNAYIGGSDIVRYAPFRSTDVGRYIRIFDYVAGNWVTGQITAYGSEISVTVNLISGNLSGAGSQTWSADSYGWELGLYSDTLGYPTAGCFHEDRLFMVGPKQYFAGSRTGQYENFQQNDADRTVTVSHALMFALNSNDISNCKWVHPDERGLLIGTTASEWIIKSASSVEAISPLSIDAKQATSLGSRNVYPVKVGKSVIFVQPAGRIVQELNYFFDVDGFRANNVTRLAHHITESGIVQMAVQKEPQTLIWCVRNDGILAGCTYERDADGLKAAWHRHQLGGVSDAAFTNAIVESVTSIPAASGDYDEVWLVVRRRINGSSKRYIEYFSKFFDSEDQEKDAFFVDCGKTYDDPKTITGITAASPPVVTSVAHGFSNGDEILLSEIDGMVELNNFRAFAKNVAADTFELKDENGVDIDATGFTPYVSGGYARKMVASISGAGHLEGQEVDILGDGAALEPATVTAGVISLGTKCATVHYGLNYKSKGKLPRLEAGASDGTALGKTKRVHRVSVMLDRSRGLKLGTDFENMTEIDFSSDSSTSGHAPPLFTGIKREEFSANYDTENQICFMQDKPLPSTILAVLPQLQTQDG